MLSASRVRVAVCAAATIVVALASATNVYNPQFIVLGRNGQVLDHVDPSLYLHTRKKQAAAPQGTPAVPVERVHPRTAQQGSEAESIEVPGVRYESSVVSSKLLIVQISSEAEEHKTVLTEGPDATVVEAEHVEGVIVRSASLPEADRALETQQALYREAQQVRCEVRTSATLCGSVTQDGLGVRTTQEFEYDEFLQLESSLLDLEGDSQQVRWGGRRGQTVAQALSSTLTTCCHSSWRDQQAVEVPEVSPERADVFDASSFPGVPGSILFSEMVCRVGSRDPAWLVFTERGVLTSVPLWMWAALLSTQSCLFVAFIGYLVHSIPLWSRFSCGQRWCLVVAFSAAILYQVATVSWYFDLVSPEVMIGLSSLITRMISLGMVPITTTSFIGRAREACSEQQQLLQQLQQQQQQSQQHQVTLPSSGSGRSSRRHPRARAS